MPSLPSGVDVPPADRPAPTVTPAWNRIDNRPQDALAVHNRAAKLDGGIVAAPVEVAHLSADIALFLVGEIEQVSKPRSVHGWLAR